MKTDDALGTIQKQETQDLSDTDDGADFFLQEGKGENPSVIPSFRHFRPQSRTTQGFSNDGRKNRFRHSVMENPISCGFEDDGDDGANDGTLGGHDVRIPPFPLQVFPAWLQNIVAECENAFSCPQKIVVSAVLSAAACCLGGSCALYVKKDYKRKPPLYLVLVAPSGTGKSPCCDFLFDPIHAHNKREYDRYKNDLNKSLEAGSKKKGEEKVIVAPPKFLTCSDITVEKLAEKLQSPRGTYIIDGEILGFFKGMGRYNTDKESYTTLLNKAYSYTSWVKERVTSDTIFISNPTLGIFGETQARIVREMFDKTDKDSGFLARFNFIFCEQEKPRYLSDASVSNEAKETWERFLRMLCSQEIGIDGRPVEYIASPEAFSSFKQWQKMLADEQFASDSDGFRAALSKLECTCISVALILHFIEAFPDTPPKLVSGSTFHKATMIADWLCENVRYFFLSKSENISSFERKVLSLFIKNREVLLDRSRKDNIVRNDFLKGLVSEALGLDLKSVRPLAAALRKLGANEVRKGSGRGFVFTDELFGKWEGFLSAGE